MPCAGADDSSLSGTLQQGCPSYFREEDKVYYAANGELRRAQTLQGAQRQEVAQAALEKLLRVSVHPLHQAWSKLLRVSVAHCTAAGMGEERSLCISVRTGAAKSIC